MNCDGIVHNKLKRKCQKQRSDPLLLPILEIMTLRFVILDQQPPLHERRYLYRESVPIFIDSGHNITQWGSVSGFILQDLLGMIIFTQKLTVNLFV